VAADQPVLAAGARRTRRHPHRHCPRPARLRPHRQARHRIRQAADGRGRLRTDAPPRVRAGGGGRP
jgi:hypothetical protein